MAQKSDIQKLIDANEEYQRRKGQPAPSAPVGSGANIGDLAAASRAARVLPARTMSPTGRLVNVPRRNIHEQYDEQEQQRKQTSRRRMLSHFQA